MCVYIHVCVIHSSPFLSRQDIHMFTYRAAGSAVGSISSFGEKYRGVGMPITILIITLMIVTITIVIVTIIMMIITINHCHCFYYYYYINCYYFFFPIIYPLVAEWGAPLYSSTSGTRRAMVPTNPLVHHHLSCGIWQKKCHTHPVHTLYFRTQLSIIYPVLI